MSIESICDVMALIRKAPRSAVDIVGVTGLTEKTVRGYLDHLLGEGHIGQCATKPNKVGRPTAVYAWREPINGPFSTGMSFAET